MSNRPPWMPETQFGRKTERARRIRNAVRAALIWLVLLFVGGFLQGFFLEPPLQQRVCRWDPLTPMCRALSIGNLPSPAMERDFATAKSRATRDGWNAFREKYPDGPLDSAAERALEACKPAPTDTWSDDVMPPLPLRTGPVASQGSEVAARRAALEAADALGSRVCGAYDGGEFQLTGIRLDGEVIGCETSGGQTSCAWDGRVFCEVKVRDPVQEVC